MSHNKETAEEHVPKQGQYQSFVLHYKSYTKIQTNKLSSKKKDEGRPWYTSKTEEMIQHDADPSETASLTLKQIYVTVCVTPQVIYLFIQCECVGS